MMRMEIKYSTSKVLLWYGTPLWAVRLVLLICLICAVLFLAAGFNFEIWIENESVLYKYFLYLLGLAFLSANLRPRNWQKWTYFVATAEGIEFPSDIPLANKSTWLLVPWSKVGEIKVSRFVGNKAGPAIEILISEEEQEKYFPGNRIMGHIFNTPQRSGNYTLVGYSNIFLNKERIVKRLNYIKDARDK
jgi:hypothetical protein